MSAIGDVEDKTVFVIGAGASFEVGMPVGSSLRNTIASLVDIRFERGSLERGDPLIAEAVDVLAGRTEKGDRNVFWRAGWRIRDGMNVAQSIDNFLDQHSDEESLVQLGKLGIVRSILIAESTSKLMPHQISKLPNLGGLDATWFNSFYQVLTENCRLEQLSERFGKVVFVIFNYDRCIEHYLCSALQMGYGLSVSQAAELVSKIEIYHPYGVVAPLFEAGSKPALGFGKQPNAFQLVELTRDIKTFTEGTDESSSFICAIRDHMQTAHRIVFLGFAFHPMNVRLLYPKQLERDSRLRRIYGTGHGISTEDIAIIRADLSARSGIQGVDILIKAGTVCADLFSTHRRSLGFV